MIEPAQSAAGRALVGWSQGDLAEAASVPLSLVERFESRAGGAIPADMVERIKIALESAGIAFIPRDAGGSGVGVRLSKSGESKYLGWEDLNASNDE
jgi:hypothetical protein